MSPSSTSSTNADPTPSRAPPNSPSSSPPTTSPSALPASPSTPPRGPSAICEAFGECVCHSDAASDLTRAAELDASTAAVLVRMRASLRQSEVVLAAQAAANHRAAVTGPQTGRARRSHHATEIWIAKQRRVLKAAWHEVRTLENALEVGRRDREIAVKGDSDNADGESTCGVM